MKNLIKVFVVIAITLFGCNKQASTKLATEEQSKKGKGNSSLVVEATTATLPLPLHAPDTTGGKKWTSTYINWCVDSSGTLIKRGGAMVSQYFFAPAYVMEWNNTTPFNNTAPSGTWIIQEIEYTVDANNVWVETRFPNVVDVVIP